MKTIKISDEMYAQLMELSKEINTQNHRHTQMPYIFQIESGNRRWPKLENAFFTAKACKEHIKKNSYHYTKPTDFLTSAIRNLRS